MIRLLPTERPGERPVTDAVAPRARGHTGSSQQGVTKLTADGETSLVAQELTREVVHMEPLEELTDELAALHRGQGVRTGDIHRLIGPALMAALQLEDPLSPVQARDYLISGLVAGIRTLPPRQATVFEFASGLKSAEPTMAARLDRAASELDRDTRTLRRWLEKANVGVAIYLMRNHGHAEVEASGHPRRDDWYIESMWVEADLRARQPVFRIQKSLFPTVGGATQLTEPISLPPHPAESLGDISVAISGGARLIEVRRSGPSLWMTQLSLPAPMRVGEIVTFGLECTLPARDWMAPMSVFTPIRPTREFRCTVHFGSPMVAKRAWILRNALPNFFGVEPMTPLAEEIDLAADVPVDVRFTNPLPGLTSGIQWAWADDAP